MPCTESSNRPPPFDAYVVDRVDSGLLHPHGVVERTPTRTRTTATPGCRWIRATTTTSSGRDSSAATRTATTRASSTGTTTTGRTGSWATSSMAFLSSNGIALPTWAEKPGCRQARSLRARSSEIACRSMRRASRRSRKSFRAASASQVSSGRRRQTLAPIRTRRPRNVARLLVPAQRAAELLRGRRPWSTDHLTPRVRCRHERVLHHLPRTLAVWTWAPDACQSSRHRRIASVCLG